MDAFKAVVNWLYGFLNMSINVWGYSFTYWQILILYSVATTAGILISVFVRGDY